jgi:hypothetical protein
MKFNYQLNSTTQIIFYQIVNYFNNMKMLLIYSMLVFSKKISKIINILLNTTKNDINLNSISVSDNF